MKFRAGFTIIELLIVMTIIASLAALTYPSLLGSRAHAEVKSNLYPIIGDIKSQQLKAMTGDTEGRGTNDTYGVHFETTSYTLFHGASYNVSDTSNSIVKLPGDLEFRNVTFPSATILFLKGSGEISGFVDGHSGFDLIGTSTNEDLGVSFNQLGVATTIQ